MKYIKTLLAIALLGFSFSASAQCTDPEACNFNETTVNDLCLSVETVLEHTSGALAGQTTYRLYVNFPADDTYYISSISGDGDAASNIQSLNISTTTDFYQDPVGSLTADGITLAAYNDFPTLEYDSWITIIGDAGEGIQINTVNGEDQDWGAEFETGGDIAIDNQAGGAWFVMNNAFAGNEPPKKVLIAQLTTDGDLSGQVTVNYFAPGLGYSLQNTLSLDGACEFGACVYPEAYLTCGGDCVNDTDGDGICDEFEVAGCGDTKACNYDALATDFDQTLCDFSCADLELFVSEPCEGQTSVNYNGQDYNLVEIDGKCWFAEDLRTTSYNNGIVIDEVNDPELWSALPAPTSGKTTYYEEGLGVGYRSYNWYAVETGLLCPTGWHVATNKDWNSLEAEAFGVRGQNLGSRNQLVTGNTDQLYDLGWFSQYTNNNVFGDVAFSGGLRTNVDGQWKDSEGSIYWWTAEDYNGRNSNSNRKNSAWARGVKRDASWGRFKDLWSTSNSKNNALRVRCVKGGAEIEEVSQSIDPVFFITPGPTTLGTTDTDYQVNAGDTVYVDVDGSTSPAGQFFANVAGETFVTDKRGVLIPADNYKKRRDQKVFTVGEGDDIIDSEIGIAGGGPLVTCACCCYAGSNSYLQEFTVSTRRSCGWWCQNRSPGNCEAFQWSKDELCMDDLTVSIANYIEGQTMSVKDKNLLDRALELVKFRIDGDLEAGSVINFSVNEKAIEDITSKMTVKPSADFDVFKGFWFTFEDKVYRINDSFILEGGGDEPLPEWGAGPDDIINVCACWQSPPDCAKYYYWTNRQKGCHKICKPDATVFPGSPPCDTPGGIADENEIRAYSKFGPIVKFNGDNPVFRNINDAVSYGRAAGLRGIQEVVAPSVVYSEEADTVIVANANAVGFMAGDAESVGFSLGDVELEWSYDLADFAKRNTNVGQFYTSSFLYPGDRLYLNSNYDELSQVMYARQTGSLIYKIENGIVNAITDIEYNAIKSANAGLNWVDEDFIPREGPFSRFCECDDGGWKNCLKIVPCTVCCKVVKKYVYGIASLYDSDDSDEDDSDEFHAPTKFGYIVDFDINRPVFRNLEAAINYSKASGIKGVRPVSAPKYVYSAELDDLVLRNEDAFGFVVGDIDDIGFELGNVQIEWSYDLADFARGATNTGQFYTSSFLFPGDELYLNDDLDPINQVMYVRQNGGLIFKVENNIVDAVTTEEYNTIKSANAGLNWVDEDIIPSGPFGLGRWTICPPCGVKCWAPFGGWAPCRFCCAVAIRPDFSKGPDSDDEDIDTPVVSKYNTLIGFNQYRPVFRSIDDAISYGTAAGLAGTHEVVAPRYAYSSRLKEYVVVDKDAVGYVAGPEGQAGFAKGRVQLEWSYDLADFARGTTSTQEFYSSSFLRYGDFVYLNSSDVIDNTTFYVRQAGGLVYKVEQGVVNAITDTEYNNIKAANRDLVWDDEDFIPRGPFGRWVSCSCTNKEGDVSYGVRCWSPFGGQGVCGICCALTRGPNAP